MALIKIGYWYSKDEPHLPRPQDFVDKNWNKDEREIVIAYLENGKDLKNWRGYSWCRMCSKNANGTTCQGDKKYMWPEGYPHYLAVHDVKPPQHFIDHVLAQS